jgi:hypothetical protein
MKSKENGAEYALWCAKSVAALFAAEDFKLATEEQLLGKVAAFLAHGPPTAYASLLQVCRASIVLWSRRKRFPD